MSTPYIPASRSSLSDYAEQLLTPVELPPDPPQLTSNDRILLLGSCFAQEVGERLKPQFPEGHVCVNPLGPLYAPQTVVAVLQSWLNGEQPAAPFRGRDGLWHSWQASSVCSAPTEAECRQKLAAAWEQGREALAQATLIVLTFGTTRGYALRSGMSGWPDGLVANCHKEVADTFVEHTPELPALVAHLSAFCRQLSMQGNHPALLLTVSPYRYRKYGLHQSQLQKARLLLLCEELCAKAGASYFPSYEILLDELRDYRFYAPDMLHPSSQAVDIIAERFRRWAFSPALLAEGDARLRAWRQVQHRAIVER